LQRRSLVQLGVKNTCCATGRAISFRQQSIGDYPKAFTPRSDGESRIERVDDAIRRATRSPFPRGPELQRVGGAQRMDAQQAPRLRLDGLDVDDRVTRAQQLIDAHFGFVGVALISYFVASCARGKGQGAANSEDSLAKVQKSKELHVGYFIFEPTIMDRILGGR